MTDRKLRMILVLLAGIAGSTVAQAQTPAALIYDPGVVAINFGAGDLKAALQQNGYSVTDLPLGDPSAATQPVRVILTTSDASVPGKPSPSGLASLNADRLKLFDAAAGWAMGQAVPSWFQPPILQAGQLRLEWVGGGTLETATNVPGPWSDVSGAVSPYLNPTTNPAHFFRVKQ